MNREIEVPIAPTRLPRRLRRASETSLSPAPRIPRIIRLMALAIKFDELIRRGEVRDYAELARLGHVTRARITQIMNLLNLAPQIQEALLFLDGATQVRLRTPEHDLRVIARSVAWQDQILRFQAGQRT
ncbi:MAG: hypothetical protein ACP5UT_18775 [Bryobacteraceae bacterium]